MQVISHQPPIYFLTSPNSQRSGHFFEKTYGFPCDPACPQQDPSPFSWLSPPANLLHNSGVTAKFRRHPCDVLVAHGKSHQN